jgi:hypothetical protein
MSSLPDVPYFVQMYHVAYPGSGDKPTRSHATLLCAALSMELEKGVMPMKNCWAVACPSGVIAGLYLATECLYSQGLSQLLIHHVC